MLNFCLKGKLIVVIAATLIIFSTVMAEGAVLKGKVLDINDMALSGAMVFVYDSPKVRRSADFISAPTDREGNFQMVVPEGKYWVIARLKKSGEYGPLMPGDKHSGDSVEIELGPESEYFMDFVVLDLKEAIRVKADMREGTVRISGRVIDDNGVPVNNVYAFASKRERFMRVPDFISTWVDKEGNYTLYVPQGEYFIGAAYAFPPGKNFFINRKVEVDMDKTGVDITVKSLSESVE